MVIDKNIINILISMSSAVLSLIGLISIFVSISTEHRVNRARELLWDLQMAPTLYMENNEPNQTTNLTKTLLYYNSIVSSSKDFTHNVVRIAQVSIVIVAVIWLIAMVFMLLDAKNIERIYSFLCLLLIISVLAFVFYILGRLSDVAKLAQLPSGEELLNMNNNLSSLNRLWLAAHTMKLVTKVNHVDELGFISTFSVDFILPFYNFHMNSSLQLRSITPKETIPELIDNFSFFSIESNGAIFECKQIVEDISINKNSYLEFPYSHRYRILLSQIRIQDYIDNYEPVQLIISMSINDSITQVTFDLPKDLFQGAEDPGTLGRPISLCPKNVSYYDLSWFRI